MEYKIRPKHWYQWLNPFWWSRKSILEETLNWTMNSPAVKAEFEERQKNYLIYGSFVSNEELKIDR